MGGSEIRLEIELIGSIEGLDVKGEEEGSGTKK